MALSASSKDVSMALSVDNKLAKPSASPRPLADPSNLGAFNPGPISATSQVLKYIENHLQLIFQIVLESKPPALRNFDKLRKRSLKAKALDIYNSKSYIDCYNFIQ